MVDKLSVDFFCIGNRSRPWETKCMPYEQNVIAAFWDLLCPTCFHSESMRKMVQHVCGLAHACPFSLIDQQKIMYSLNYMVVSCTVTVTESAAMLGPRAGATSLHRGQFRCIVRL